MSAAHWAVAPERGRMADHPLYSTWREMVNRCRPNTRRVDYGAAGIAVCERWRVRGGFWNFVDDMGPKPTPLHTLDRRDSTGPYRPDNCRWADRVTQGRNRRGTHAQHSYDLAFVMWRDGHTRAEITRVTGIASALVSGFCRGLEMAFAYVKEMQ